MTGRIKMAEVASAYEILRIREANGGRPIQEGWRRWSRAQEAIEK